MLRTVNNCKRVDLKGNVIGDHEVSIAMVRTSDDITSLNIFVDKYLRHSVILDTDMVMKMMETSQLDSADMSVGQSFVSFQESKEVSNTCIATEYHYYTAGEKDADLVSLLKAQFAFKLIGREKDSELEYSELCKISTSLDTFRSKLVKPTKKPKRVERTPKAIVFVVDNDFFR